jgi:hypothetical protein
VIRVRSNNVLALPFVVILVIVCACGRGHGGGAASLIGVIDIVRHGKPALIPPESNGGMPTCSKQQCVLLERWRQGAPR